MAKRARRQHTVSKFYLKAFANDSNVIRRVAVPSRDVVDLSVNSASVIKDFYTVRLIDGSLSDMFEQAFGQIEGGAAAAHQQLLAGAWPLTGEARLDLAMWIALQHLRTEGTRGDHEVLRSTMIRLVVGMSGKEALRAHIEQAEQRTVTDAELQREWDDLTQPGGPSLEPDVVAHIDSIMALLPGFAAYLADCHWTLYRFQRRCLITSDHPVSLCVGPEHPAMLGVGIANTELFLVPMSRRVAIGIQPPERLLKVGFTEDQLPQIPDFVAPPSTKLALSINQETAARVRRYLYHHPADEPLEGLWIREDEPAPGMREPDIDHFIRPEGPPANPSPVEQPRPPLLDEHEGVGLSDLPWPIPGRRPPTEDDDGEQAP